MQLPSLVEDVQVFRRIHSWGKLDQGKLAHPVPDVRYVRQCISYEFSNFMYSVIVVGYRFPLWQRPPWEPCRWYPLIFLYMDHTGLLPCPIGPWLI